MKQKILITSALPYANAPLHFGHIAGAYLPADCYTRFERLRGNDVLYICGSDEYGVAITLSAELAGRTPKEHVDYFHVINQDLFSKLNFQFDHFSRTTWSKHQETTHQFFKDLLENGYIEERETEQLYSEKENRFLADRYVVGICPLCGFLEARGDECPKCGGSFEATNLKEPRSKITNSPLILKKTVHWFLRFDLFKDKLIKFLESRNWKPNVVNFSKHYIDDLHPRAITRDLEWGIPVPLEKAKGKVFYVWFDAPIGYISATKEWSEKIGRPDAWKDYWLDPQTRYVQFIGKDNIPFHAIFFPAMEMGQNLPYKIVDDLAANEFYNLEGRKFSKSDGWVIDLHRFFEKFTADQIRYTIASNAPENSDSEFSWKDFQSRCNSDLLGKFGNLVNRVLVFLKTHCQSIIPHEGELESIDRQFQLDIEQKMAEIVEHYAQYKLRRTSQLVMELAMLGNTYFDAKQPWKDVKDPSKRARLETTLKLCLECIKCLSLASYPIIPQSANAIWKMLGFNTSLELSHWNNVVHTPLSSGLKLPEPTILFKKVEDEVIAEEIELLREQSEKAQKEKQKNLASIASPTYEPLKPSISIDQFKQVDLRVGIIKKAQKVEKSKKLLQLEVDLGFEIRNVVSGISLHYQPEELIGKKIILVANLEPATIMGLQSNGMVLAGSIDQSLELATVLNLAAGAVVS